MEMEMEIVNDSPFKVFYKMARIAITNVILEVVKFRWGMNKQVIESKDWLMLHWCTCLRFGAFVLWHQYRDTEGGYSISNVLFRNLCLLTQHVITITQLTTDETIITRVKKYNRNNLRNEDTLATIKKHQNKRKNNKMTCL